MRIVWLLALAGAISIGRFLRAEWRSYHEVRRGEREAAREAAERARREAERKERLRWN